MGERNEGSMNVCKNLISIGVVRILGRNGVSKRDIRRVLKAAKNITIPSDKKIAYIFPLEYRVDDKKKIENPFGMKGFRLEVRAILIIGQKIINRVLNFDIGRTENKHKQMRYVSKKQRERLLASGIK